MKCKICGIITLCGPFIVLDDNITMCVFCFDKKEKYDEIFKKKYDEIFKVKKPEIKEIIFNEAERLLFVTENQELRNKIKELEEETEIVRKCNILCIQSYTKLVGNEIQNERFRKENEELIEKNKSLSKKIEYVEIDPVEITINGRKYLMHSETDERIMRQVKEHVDNLEKENEDLKKSLSVMMDERASFMEAVCERSNFMAAKCRELTEENEELKNNIKKCGKCEISLGGTIFRGSLLCGKCYYDQIEHYKKENEDLKKLVEELKWNNEHNYESVDKDTIKNLQK